MQSGLLQYNNHLRNSKNIIINGFRKAHITQAVLESVGLINLFENPFQDIEIAVE